MPLTLKISLICATVNRKNELVRLLNSLSNQTYKNFELIIVDQNPSGFLDSTLDTFIDKLEIKHLYSSYKNTSAARNIGIHSCSGEIVAFPDDDCWYPENFLDNVNLYFDNNKTYDGLIAGRPIDPENNLSTGRYDNFSNDVTLKNIFKRVCCVTIFIKREAVLSINGFDKNIGPGSNTRIQAAEDPDFIIRIIRNGYKVFYNHEMRVYHPYPEIEYNKKTIKRAYIYGIGLGYLLRKYNYPFLFSYYTMFIRPLLGIIFSLFKFKRGSIKYYISSIHGRYIGYTGK